MRIGAGEALIRVRELVIMDPHRHRPRKAEVKGQIEMKGQIRTCVHVPMERANHTTVDLSISAKVLLRCYLCLITQTTDTRQVRGYAITTWVKLWFRDSTSLVQCYLTVCTD